MQQRLEIAAVQNIVIIGEGDVCSMCGIQTGICAFAMPPLS